MILSNVNKCYKVLEVKKLNILRNTKRNTMQLFYKNLGKSERLVIREAFQVDKKGQIAKSRILGLRKYNIKDPKWQEAMELIGEAIQVISSKQYIAFYVREDDKKAFKQVPLNFSSL